MVKMNITERRKRFQSTKQWVRSLMHMEAKHESIVENFAKNHQNNVYTSPKLDNAKTEPINILLIDGGGSKGLAAIPIFKCIQEHYVKDGKDLFSQFDLIGGTSVGGLSSLLISYYKGGMKMSTDAVCEKMKEVGDLIREKCFKKISFCNLLFCNNLIKDSDSNIVNVLKNDFEKPLRSDSYIPTMVCIASVKDNDIVDLNSNNHSKKREFEPFVARTYDYPPQCCEEQDVIALANSSSDMMLNEAMAATSAMPLLVERVRVEVDGKEKVMADGMMFQSCPISLCLDQAERLYPGRPIGTILNIGFGTDEVMLIEKTVEAAKMKHVNMHFHRICPHHIMEKFSPAETDLKKTAKMEDDVKDWLLNNEEVAFEIRKTMKSLFDSPPRTFGECKD